MRYLILILLTACSQGPNELYIREAALPMNCLVPMTLDQAKSIAAYTLPTVPITIEVASGKTHRTRRDPVMGTYTITLIDGAITGQAIAHELAHDRVRRLPPQEHWGPI